MFSFHPAEKFMFWSIVAGLSWSCAGPKQLAPAHDQLKPAHDQLRTSLNQFMTN